MRTMGVKGSTISHDTFKFDHFMYSPCKIIYSSLAYIIIKYLQRIIFKQGFLEEEKNLD